MRRNHLSFASPLRPASSTPPTLTLLLYPSLSLSFFSLPLTLFRFTLAHYYRRTASYERRHCSAGWSSVVSRPRARAKAPSLLPLPPTPSSLVRPTLLPSPILATTTCGLFDSTFLSQTSARFPSFPATVPLPLAPSFSPASFFLLFQRAGESRLFVQRSNFLFLSRGPIVPSRSLRWKKHDPRYLVLSSLSPSHLLTVPPFLSLALYLSFSRLNFSLLSKYLAETRVCLPSPFFSFACLLRTLLAPTTVVYSRSFPILA